MLLAASYVLLTLGGTGPRVRAGITYVVVSLLSSLIFLAGIAFVYMATGTLNMAQISDADGRRAAGHAARDLPSCCSSRSASRPRCSRCRPGCPDSYPTATAPVTAVFAGLLTKVGVYAIIRTQTLLFPGDGAARRCC